MFEVQIGINSPTSGSRYGIELEANNTRKKLTAYYASGTLNMYIGATYMVKLSAGDLVDVKAFFADTKTIAANDTYTYFEGYLLYK